MAEASTSNGVKNRIEIPFFDGVNLGVGDNLSRKDELSYSDNVRSKIIGYTQKRTGVSLVGSVIPNEQATLGLFYFKSTNVNSQHIYRISKVGGVTKIYWLHNDNTWQIMTGPGTYTTGLDGNAIWSNQLIDGMMFISNGVDNNAFIDRDGVTIIDSTTATNHLYLSPKAYKIGFFNDKIYANFKDGDIYTRIQMSSPLSGIVSLANEDKTTGFTTLKVTSTKYIRNTDTLDVYRDNNYIGQLSITSKGSGEITCTASGFVVKSSDEFWIPGTHGSVKKYRWTDNPSSGVDVAKYDTFKVPTNENEPLTVMDKVGNVEIFSGKNSMYVWDGEYLKTISNTIGCVSNRGYVVAQNALYFVGYNGIYATTGSQAPVLMSRKIQKIFDGATKTNLENATVGKNNDSIFFSIGDVNIKDTDGFNMRTIENCVIELDLTSQNWHIHSGKYMKSNIYASECTIGDSADVLLYAEHRYGRIVRMFTPDVFTDSIGGTDSVEQISTNITTNALGLSSNFEEFAYVQAIILDMKAGSGLHCFLFPDSQDAGEVSGVLEKGVYTINTTLGSTRQYPNCRNIKISLRETSDQNLIIGPIAVNITSTLDTVPDQTLRTT